jgi:hypothetical protein
MAGGFLTKRVLLVKEAVAGVVPATPICVEFLSESFDLKQTQSSEEINLLGSGGDASPMAFGTSSFSGAVGLVASTDNMPIILTHILGTKLTTAAATAAAWADATVYVAGDIVNTVVSTKHSLICVAGGTSAATEPTLNANPNNDRNARVIDNTVAWIAMPKLVTDTFERKQQLPTFTIEYELEDAAGTSFYKRFSNVNMNAMPIAMTGGTISLKISGDFIGASSIDSRDAAWVSPLASIAGAKIVSNFKDFYSYEDCTVKADGIALTGVESINLDVTRNVTVADAVNSNKIKDIGITSVKGSMNRVFTFADYDAYKTHTDFAVIFDFQKTNGCGVTLTYPYVKPGLADPVQSIDKQAYLSTEISAYGKGAVQSVRATCTYPSLVDSTGTIVGAY